MACFGIKICQNSFISFTNTNINKCHSIYTLKVEGVVALRKDLKKIDQYYQINSATTVPVDHDDKYNVGDLDICNASCTMDCTGLMGRPPMNEEETDSYHDIYTFGPPDLSRKDI